MVFAVAPSLRVSDKSIWSLAIVLCSVVTRGRGPGKRLCLLCRPSAMRGSIESILLYPRRERERGGERERESCFIPSWLAIQRLP